MAVLICTLPVGAGADDALQEIPAEVESALTPLMSLFTSGPNEPQVDLAALSSVVDFISHAPEMVSFTPGERHKAKGSFIAYTIKRSLSEIVRYAYNPQIPEGAVNPSSINHTNWTKLPGGDRILPDVWKTLSAASPPLLVKGMTRETISPDLHSGAYYEYDLQRAFLIYRKGSKRMIVSFSEQIGDSEVGRKGFIVGDDQDWNYLYTPEQGLDISGLGWVKSKIYTFFSVCFYLEDDAHPGAVRIGVFQWLGAGWIGVNMVDSHHIRKGMMRYAEQFKGMLESAEMPDPGTLEKIFLALTNTREEILREKALDVTRYIKQKAQKDDLLKGKSAIRKLNEEQYIAQMDKGQVISILMREYVKYCLGKETPLSANFWLALKDGNALIGQPLS